jgi:hypothetical protein
MLVVSECEASVNAVGVIFSSFAIKSVMDNAALGSCGF